MLYDPVTMTKEPKQDELTPEMLDKLAARIANLAEQYRYQIQRMATLGIEAIPAKGVASVNDRIKSIQGHLNTISSAITGAGAEDDDREDRVSEQLKKRRSK